MKFFKKEEKRPFSYPTIIEEKKSADRLPFMVGMILLIIVVSFIYLLIVS